MIQFGTVPPKLKNRKVTRIATPEFSDEDEDLRSIEWSLSTKGYAVTDRTVDGEGITVRAHRVVLERMLGRRLEKHEEVDHRNLNKLDNRRGNLRATTRQTNSENQGLRADNSSGHRGVYWSKASSKWMVYVTQKGKWHYGGLHVNIDDAARKAKEMREALGFLSQGAES